MREKEPEAEATASENPTTDTDGTAPPEALLAPDYEHLFQLGQALWPTFFNLASMSFTWNASLATGFGFLAFFEFSPESVLMAANAEDVAEVIGPALCLVGIIYNLGALRAYNMMTDVMARTITRMLEYDPTGQTLKMPEIILDLIPDVGAQERRSRQLGRLTNVFFTALILCWIGGLAYSVYAIVIDVVEV